MNADTDAGRHDLLKKYLGQDPMIAANESDLISTTSTLKKKAFDSLMLDISKSKSNAFDTLKALRLSIDIAVMLIESGMLNIKGQKSHSLVELEKVMEENFDELYQRVEKFVNLDNLTIMKASRQVMVADESLSLTPNEFNLLVLLIDEAGTIVSKEILSQQGIGRTFQAHHRSIDMHISNLRKKLGSDSQGRERIKTVHGVGYQYINYPVTDKLQQIDASPTTPLNKI